MRQGKKLPKKKQQNDERFIIGLTEQQKHMWNISRKRRTNKNGSDCQNSKKSKSQKDGLASDKKIKTYASCVIAW